MAIWANKENARTIAQTAKGAKRRRKLERKLQRGVKQVSRNEPDGPEAVMVASRPPDRRLTLELTGDALRRFRERRSPTTLADLDNRVP